MTQFLRRSLSVSWGILAIPWAGPSALAADFYQGKLADMMRALAAATTPQVVAEFQKLASGK